MDTQYTSNRLTEAALLDGRGQKITYPDGQTYIIYPYDNGDYSVWQRGDDGVYDYVQTETMPDFASHGTFFRAATAPTPARRIEALLIEIRDLLRGLTEREDRESRMERWMREPWDDAPATDTQEDSATEGEGSS